MAASGMLRSRVALGTVIVLGTILVGSPAVFMSSAGSEHAPVLRVDVDPALAGIRQGSVPIIVQKQPGASGVEGSISRLGGSVTRDLSIVNGFAAVVPAASLADLSRVTGVRVISLDRTVRVAEGPGGSANSVYRKVVRADDVNQAGYKGQGMTVAVVDTGIADVPDLAGRIVQVETGLLGDSSPCQNFSGEPGCEDSYGHGTFIAGIIAGNGASSGGKWKGVAPQAKVLSVKIAGRSGSADVSTLLAAIQWVVSYKNTYDIKVLNLSLGTTGTQSYTTDPLNYAVQEAWEKGIVVVVSASNAGPEPGTITKPGDDPWVITVGATDDRGTPGLGDDELPNFSARGPTAADGMAKPDLAAPGGHIVSLRAPGSEIDEQFPNYIDGAYRKGSGTSMSTAVVSGTVALMLQRNPSWSPNRVKFALTATARDAASDDVMAVGAGVADAHSATFSAPAGTANAGLDRSSGMGSLDASRGTVRVQADDVPPTLISGLLTAQLLLWDPILYIGVGWNALTWQGSQWYGSQWYGSQWYGSQWYGSQWYGSQWYGELNGSQWYGSQWYGSQWYGAWE
jgi:serine protease AprX